MGVPGHFSICGIFVVNFRGIFVRSVYVLLYFDIFVRYFLWRGGGGVYMVPLPYDNGMVPC